MDQIDEAEARRIMSGGLGRAELELVSSFTAPLYWVVENPGMPPVVRNGSAFFLDTGHAVFGVTAAHVIDGLKTSRAIDRITAVQIGPEHTLDLGGANAIIASDPDIDIATFKFSRAEVAALGKTVLTGSQSTWPPQPPQRDRGVTFAGFPACETRWEERRTISFGAAPGGGIATSVSEKDVSTQLERAHWIDMLGLGLPAENFDFGGMSGGPMLSIIERAGIRSWALAGVIYQGPNIATDVEKAISGFEVIRARRAHFIREDGTLDTARWRSL